MAGGDMKSALMKGPVAWMVRNSVAANLLMLVLVLGGALGLSRMKTEVFPEFSLDTIVVSVLYPGASPEEVEQGIVLAIEEEVQGLDGVKRVTSTAAEDMGMVSIELLIEADPDRVLSDVKTAVDAITSFPEEAEEPQVSLPAVRREVISLILSGEVGNDTLHALSEKARAELLAQPGVTQVETFGLPPLEISISVPRQTLEAYNLTLDEIATQIRAASLELPGGGVDTDGGEILVRVADRRETGNEFADILLRSTAVGAGVRLGDIATIRDGFAETDQAAYYNGQPAVRVVAYRVGDETPTSVATAVKSYAKLLESELPDSVTVSIWDDDSKLLEGRIKLLMDNAKIGLVLVVALLALFLDLHLAFWVALGIPTCFLGAFWLLPGLDISVNMVSLFAFIITLGLVVDDAIIIGENIHTLREQGVDRLEAAVIGIREMISPVSFAVLTTVVAFSPLLLVPGFIGKIFGIIPGVVISVLVLSLLESFFILPAHLAHDTDKPPGFIRRLADRPRLAVARWLERFTRDSYRPLLEKVLRQRYIAIATAMACFALSIGVVISGAVPFAFFPKLEGDMVTVSARLPYGAPITRTEAVRVELEQALGEAVASLGGAEGLLLGSFTTVGEASSGGGGPGPQGSEVGSHLLSISVNLVSSEDRDISSAEFAAAWSAMIPPLPGVEALSMNSSSGPGAGAAVDVQLSHPDVDVLADAAAEVTEALRSFDSLTDVVNGYSAGKEQLDFHILPQGRNLGLTGSDVARQLRSAFYGAEALREQRGRNEVKVMVRLPPEQRRSEYDIEQLRIRTRGSGFVPLDYVAEVERGQAPTTINREEGRRVVNVSGELASGVASSQETVAALNQTIFPQLREKYPGLSLALVGEQREQGETFASLGQNYIFALFAIYALLAVPFKSYTQPIVIMSAIPFGFIGAIAGHALMDFDLSIISMMGIVALTGVVVNDSLVLIDATNKARADGLSAWDAILYGGTRRLRPIILTSMTTFLGLAPMIVETSVQARFLIPMAISLGFGVLFGTIIILLLVPALYMVLEDLLGLFGRSGEVHADHRRTAAK